MSDIVVLRARDLHDDVVPTVKRHRGTSIPGGYAVYTVGDCRVVCHECLHKVDHEHPAPLTGFTECDFPGHDCSQCGRFLDTRILVYPYGPGAHLHPDNQEDSR